MNKLIVISGIGAIMMGGFYYKVKNKAQTKYSKAQVNSEKKKVKKYNVSLKDIISPALSNEPSLDYKTIKNCADQKEYLLRQDYDTSRASYFEAYQNEECKKELAKFLPAPKVERLLNCLNTRKLFFKINCKNHMLYYKAFAASESKEESDAITIYKLIWRMGTITKPIQKEITQNLKMINELIEKYPNSSELIRAKLINITIQDIHFGKKTLDPEFYNLKEKLTELNKDGRVLVEMHALLTAGKTVFYPYNEIKQDLEGFVLEFQNYPMAYYFRAKLAWDTKKDRKDTLEWLDSGMRLCTGDVSILKKMYKKVKKSALGKDIFRQYYDVDFLEL